MVFFLYKSLAMYIKRSKIVSSDAEVEIVLLSVGHFG